MSFAKNYQQAAWKQTVPDNMLRAFGNEGTVVCKLAQVGNQAVRPPRMDVQVGITRAHLVLSPVLAAVDTPAMHLVDSQPMLVDLKGHKI